MHAQITSTNSSKTVFGWFVAQEARLHQWFQLRRGRPDTGAPLLAEEGDALFAAAVAADSNLELDWLWLAERLDNPEQRRFCYEKARLINPRSELAYRALASAQTWRTPARELALGER